jgi:hypothetical protein
MLIQEDICPLQQQKKLLSMKKKPTTRNPQYFVLPPTHLQLPSQHHSKLRKIIIQKLTHRYIEQTAMLCLTQHAHYVMELMTIQAFVNLLKLASLPGWYLPGVFLGGGGRIHPLAPLEHFKKKNFFMKASKYINFEVKLHSNTPRFSIPNINYTVSTST